MCRTSKDFAGSVDPRCYLSYGASNSSELALRPAFTVYLNGKC